jgi:hypothetical protein
MESNRINQQPMISNRADVKMEGKCEAADGSQEVANSIMSTYMKASHSYVTQQPPLHHHCTTIHWQSVMTHLWMN